MDGMIQQLAHHNSKNIIFSFALPQARAHTSNIQTSSSNTHAKKEAIVVACHFSVHASHRPASSIAPKKILQTSDMLLYLVDKDVNCTKPPAIVVSLSSFSVF